jgi:hypothetical protein
VTYSFDFHGLSVTVGETSDQFRQLLLPGLGLHVYETRDRSIALRFRHEQAHFTSFMATGLADLYGIFSDYLLVFLHAITRRAAERHTPAGHLTVPIVHEGDETSDDPARLLILRAWRHINSLRAFLFGFGSSGTLGEFTNAGPQDDFWAEFFDVEYNRIVGRFYRFLEAVGKGSGATRDEQATPIVQLKSGRRRLSARSVMEAYAITIETFNRYFRAITTDLTTYSGPAVRDPGPLYTVAVEFMLESIGSRASAATFMAGKAPFDDYHACAGLSFAGMQVPVLQELEGEVRIEGDVDTLSCAHRFCRLVEATAHGELEKLSPAVRKNSDKQAMVHWLRAAHGRLGDAGSLRMCELALSRLREDAELAAKPAERKSIIESTWSARANLLAEPVEYVLDGGLFAEQFPCQVRYVRTSDGKVACLGDATGFQERYAFETMPLILEAAVFADQWDVMWAKFTDIPSAQRLDAIRTAVLIADLMFGVRSSADAEVPLVVSAAAAFA